MSDETQGADDGEAGSVIAEATADAPAGDATKSSSSIIAEATADRDTSAKGETPDEGEGEKAAPDVPETWEGYQAAIEDTGVVMDSARAADLLPVAHELGLSNEQVARLAKIDAEHWETISKPYTDQVEAWAKEAAQMPELQGAARKETLGLIARAATHLADPSFLKTIEDWGLGNNPTLIRLLSGYAKAYASEDGIVSGGLASGEQSAAEVLFKNFEKG